MSASDRWGDVLCPKCSNETLHIWFFDSDCRGNDQSWGGQCKNCSFVPTENELPNLFKLLDKPNTMTKDKLYSMTNPDQIVFYDMLIRDLGDPLDWEQNKYPVFLIKLENDIEGSVLLKETGLEIKTAGKKNATKQYSDKVFCFEELILYKNDYLKFLRDNIGDMIETTTKFEKKGRKIKKK